MSVVVRDKCLPGLIGVECTDLAESHEMLEPREAGCPWIIAGTNIGDAQQRRRHAFVG
jgi:hypothetical protein